MQAREALLLGEVAVKVILTSREGYVARSDILDLRLKHAELIEQIIPFAGWDQHLPVPSDVPGDQKSALLGLLSSSPGAAVLRQSNLNVQEALRRLGKDLDKRLSFDWILPNKPARRRVVVVAGRPNLEPKRNVYWSQAYVEAAQALGISLVIIDQPGSWLQGDDYAHLREEFIEMDLADVDALPQKLAKELQGRQIDGIVTYRDDYLVAVAEAAEALHLPTESSQAIKQAHFKQEMRKVLNDGALFLANVPQLHDTDLAKKLETLAFPLIVKPCCGANSRGVRKANDELSLREALRLIEKDGLADHGVLLEPYVDGPEIDANFALWDGEVKFLEVCDNFPCRADAVNAASADPFAETVLVSNTGLPSSEVEAIRASVQRDILKLGLRSGVFHSEARLRQSSMAYQDVGENGLVDLVSIGHLVGQADPYLIEVNARWPGAGGNAATLLTYGVDLSALSLLRAIDDNRRFAALSQPYAYTASEPGDGDGAQWWTAHCMVPVHREDLWIPTDFFRRLYKALPQIVPYVKKGELYAKPGTLVSPVGGTGWVGYVLLCSRQSRKHVVEMYHTVAKTAKDVLDRDNSKYNC